MLDGLALGAGLILAAITFAVAGDVRSRAAGVGSIGRTADLSAYGLLHATLMAAPWLWRERKACDDREPAPDGARGGAPRAGRRRRRGELRVAGPGGVMRVQDGRARGSID